MWFDKLNNDPNLLFVLLNESKYDCLKGTWKMGHFPRCISLLEAISREQENQKSSEKHDFLQLWPQLAGIQNKIQIGCTTYTS